MLHHQNQVQIKLLVRQLDFLHVEAKTQLSMMVSLYCVKSEEFRPMKLEYGVVNQVMSEQDMTCLPEFIDVEPSGLKKGFLVHQNDIELTKGVTAVTHGKNNPVLVSLMATVAEEGAPTASLADAKAAHEVESKAPLKT